jgi:molybdopterin-guanine dinucleotide biosynthesis protein A
MADAILILAGGSARRFPGKLEHAVEGKPMIVLVFENLRGRGYPVYIAGRGGFAPEVDAALPAPLLIDRCAPAGPLRALLSACPQIRARRIFVVGGDQTQLQFAALERLAARWQPGDEAVVPRHSRSIEPLGALYDRRAVLREGAGLRRSGGTSMRDLIARLSTRLVSVEEKGFGSVNQHGDLAEVASHA